MNKKIIAVTAIAFLCLGYVAGTGSGSRCQQPDASHGGFHLMRPKRRERVICVFDPLTPDPSALPGRSELPVPANLYDNESARRYTGIIKNKTRLRSVRAFRKQRRHPDDSAPQLDRVYYVDPACRRDGLSRRQAVLLLETRRRSQRISLYVQEIRFHGGDRQTGTGGGQV